MYAKILKANPYHDKAGKFTSKDKAGSVATLGLNDLRSALGMKNKADKQGAHLLSKYSPKQVRDHFLKKLAVAGSAKNISAPQHQNKLTIDGEKIVQQGTSLIGGSKLISSAKAYMKKYGFTKENDFGKGYAVYKDKHGNAIKVLMSGSRGSVAFGE